MNRRLNAPPLIRRRRRTAFCSWRSLPEEANKEMIDVLFDQRDGKYVESRLINTGARGLVAFVEYRDEDAAAAALSETRRIPDRHDTQHTSALR